jgi:hypothetical protein
MPQTAKIGKLIAETQDDEDIIVYAGEGLAQIIDRLAHGKITFKNLFDFLEGRLDEVDMTELKAQFHDWIEED